MTHTIHPAAEIFPMIDGEPFQALCEDIEKNGLQHGIERIDGQIIDGRNRLRACEKVDADVWFEDIELGDDITPLDYVLSVNLHRRHLTEAQRAMVAARARTKFEEEAKARMLSGKAQPDPMENLPQGQGAARDRAGEALNVSGRSVDHATKVLELGSADLIRAVDSGDVAVSTASKLATSLPKGEQTSAVKEAIELKKSSGKRASASSLHRKPKLRAGEGAERLKKATGPLWAFVRWATANADDFESLIQSKTWGDCPPEMAKDTLCLSQHMERLGRAMEARCKR